MKSLGIAALLVVLIPLSAHAGKGYGGGGQVDVPEPSVIAMVLPALYFARRHWLG